MHSRTFDGKNVGEATDLALEELGVRLEDVEISVINPGRSGILGFGGEPARIEVRLLADLIEPETPSQQRQSQTQEETDQPQQPAKEEAPARPAQGRDRRGRRGQRRRRGSQATRTAPEREETSTDDRQDQPRRQEPRNQRPAKAQQPTAEQEQPPEERDEEAEQAVADLLDYLFEALGVVANTYVREEPEGGSLVFEIEGEDAGLLIGRRGETLRALQFIVRMIVNRQLGRKAFVILDIEDYRERRVDMLRQLARRTAGRVASSGRPASLDPMSPAERRVVHVALAGNRRVHTESEGEGSQRRVVISPKR